jgi:hypothetical protein
VISEELDELFEICDRIAVSPTASSRPQSDERDQHRGDRRVDERHVAWRGRAPGIPMRLGSSEGAAFARDARMRRRSLPRASPSSAGLRLRGASAPVRSKESASSS